MDENTPQKHMATLYSKIAAVMGGLETLSKDKSHGSQSWGYASAAQVFNVIRALMAEQKLVILMQPNVVEEVADGKYLRVSYTMTIACGDTGVSINQSWIHQGGNYGDKALTGVHTSALKYFLMDLFVVSSDNVPDDDNNAGSKSKPAKSSKSSANGKSSAKSSKSGAEVHKDITKIVRAITVFHNDAAHARNNLNSQMKNGNVSINLDWRNICIKILRSRAKFIYKYNQPEIDEILGVSLHSYFPDELSDDGFYARVAEAWQFIGAPEGVSHPQFSEIMRAIVPLFDNATHAANSFKKKLHENVDITSMTGWKASALLMLIHQAGKLFKYNIDDVKTVLGVEALSDYFPDTLSNTEFYETFDDVWKRVEADAALQEAV